MKTILSLVLLILISVGVHAEETAATKLLRARTADLQPTITQVSPSVYTASGYSPANISMIVGGSGKRISAQARPSPRHIDIARTNRRSQA